jgi:hypothetical protein
MRAKFELRFGEDGYIACPYWQEIEWLISVGQNAGVHFKHKPAKQRELIETYCRDKGIAIAAYDDARRKVETEHWYRNRAGNILIPRHHVQASIVQALHPNQGRIRHRLGTSMSREQVRTFIRVSDLCIDPPKKEKDDIYSRYVKHPKTNMRRLQEDERIKNFTAAGTVDFKDFLLTPDDMESLLRWTGENVGVGSARLMGIGRWELNKFEPDLETASKAPASDTVVESDEEALERRKGNRGRRDSENEEENDDN